jgi:hypothetical protein
LRILQTGKVVSKIQLHRSLDLDSFLDLGKLESGLVERDPKEDHRKEDSNHSNGEKEQREHARTSLPDPTIGPCEPSLPV